MSNIIGIDDLLSKLKALPSAIQEGTVDGVQKAVITLKKEVKDMCPVKTGHLRDSIEQAVRMNGNTVQGTVGTQVNYAVDVELGTGRKGSQSQEVAELGLSVPHDTKIEGRAPRPFMFPAFKMHEKVIIQDINAGIDNSLRKVAKK